MVRAPTRPEAQGVVSIICALYQQYSCNKGGEKEGVEEEEEEERAEEDQGELLVAKADFFNNFS